MAATRNTSSAPNEGRRRARSGRPAARWVLLAFLLLALAVLLGVQGLSTRTTGRSATPVPGASGPLASAGPVLTWDGRRLVSNRRSAGHQIALSFDDGPDPRWTLRIATTLRRLGVPATFFVVGSEVARHPEVVRSLHRQGFELGNHTFTHADLAAVPAWERSLQIALTESAVAGAVGVRPRLVRPPYSSVPAAVNDSEEQALAHLARRGYAIALSNLDGEDWRREGAASIAKAITPPGPEGGIVLLHDGGGDRSQTVAALERVVPALQARGFRFVTVSELGGIPNGEAEVRADGWKRARGRLLLGTLAVARWTTMGLGVLLIIVTALFGARVVLLVAFARRHVRTVRGGALFAAGVGCRTGIQRGSGNRAGGALARGQ